MPDARILTVADLPAFIALRRTGLVESPWAFGSTPDDDRGSDVDGMTRSMASDAFKIVGVDHPDDPQRLVAVAGIYRNERERRNHRASIWGVYCDADHRGRGHGRAVMEAAINVARAWQGVEVIDLGVGARSEAALGLYRALGFAEWGIHDDAFRLHGEPIREYQMTLRL